MKKITLLLALLISSIGFAQQVLIEDFESSPAIEGFEGLGSATIVDTPEGTNGMTFQLVTATAGNPWQGAQVDLPSGTTVDLTDDKTMTVDVYSTVAFSVMAKVEDFTGGGAPPAANTQSHDGSGWMTLTFTFNTGSDGTQTANGTYSRIVFFPNRNAGDSGWNSPVIEATVYLDNIMAVKGSSDAGNAPTTAPPTPPSYDAENVISLFSDAYTDLSGLEFGTSWDAVNDSDEVIAGNNVKKLVFGNFLGVDFSSNKINLNDFTHFHIDLWTETETLDKSFNHKFVNFAGASTSETSAIEFATTNVSNPPLPDPNPGTWISYDIPLSSFTVANASLDREAIAQYVLSSNLGIVYIDNVYFYKEGTASVANNELLGFSMYPNPTKNLLNISAKETIQKADIFNVLGKKVMSVNVNDTQASVDVSNLSSGIYLIKYNVNDAVGTAKFVKE